MPTGAANNPQQYQPVGQRGRGVPDDGDTTGPAPYHGLFRLYHPRRHQRAVGRFVPWDFNMVSGFVTPPAAALASLYEPAVWVQTFWCRRATTGESPRTTGGLCQGDSSPWWPPTIRTGWTDPTGWIAPTLVDPAGRWLPEGQVHDHIRFKRLQATTPAGTHAGGAQRRLRLTDGETPRPASSRSEHESGRQRDCQSG